MSSDFPSTKFAISFKFLSTILSANSGVIIFTTSSRPCFSSLSRSSSPSAMLELRRMGTFE